MEEIWAFVRVTTYKGEYHSSFMKTFASVEDAIDELYGKAVYYGYSDSEISDMLLELGVESRFCGFSVRSQDGYTTTFELKKSFLYN